MSEDSKWLKVIFDGLDWRRRWKWHWWRWGQWPKQRDRRHKVTRHIVRSNWSCDQSQMLPTTSTRWPVLCCCCKQSGLDVRPKKHSEHYSVWQNPKGCSMVDNVTLLGTKGEWGGDLLLTLFHRESRIDQQVVWRGRIWKKIHQQQLHYNVGPCVAKSVTLASVEIPSKKVHNIGHNEFSALHPYCKKKNAVPGGNKPKK